MLSADDEDALTTAAAVEMQTCQSPIEMVLRPLSALQLAGLVQLALRHPEVEGAAAETGRVFLEHVRLYFRDNQAAAVVEMLRRGDEGPRPT